jgi:hypothetical protein
MSVLIDDAAQAWVSAYVGRFGRDWAPRAPGEQIAVPARNRVGLRWEPVRQIAHRQRTQHRQRVRHTQVGGGDESVLPGGQCGWGDGEDCAPTTSQDERG